MKNTIFVAIASYIDYEIRHTILDCINKSKYPDNLTFSICLQFDDREKTNEHCIDDLVEKYNIKVDKFHYRESKGGCWARNIAQQNYDKEKFSLQVDSHSRFIEGWDEIVIKDFNYLKKAGVKKPLISFLPPCYLRDDKEGIDISFDYTKDISKLNIPIISSISSQYWPVYGGYNNIQDTNFKPVNIKVLYGGFIFSLGEWVKEVEQDPLHYYTGEEFALAIRSYTHGYDMYTPSQVVAWHRAHPKAPDKHYNTNTEEVVHKHSRVAMERLKKLVFEEDLGIYGLGAERKLADYENFANIDIKNSKVLDV